MRCFIVSLFALLGTLSVGHAQPIFTDGFEGSNTATIIEVQVRGMSDHNAVTASLNNAENLRFAGDGTRAFSTQITYGEHYTVTLAQQGGSTPCQFNGQASGVAVGSKVTVIIDCGNQSESLWDVMRWDADNWQ